MRFDIQGAAMMEEPAAYVANLLKDKNVALITGEVGAGKTTLIQQVMRRLGWDGKVNSPTFNIVSEYSVNGRTVYHLDLYRLSEDALASGFLDDYFSPKALTLVEWPERLPPHLIPADPVRVALSVRGKSRDRVVEID